MCSTIEFFLSYYNDLPPSIAEELYTLRKKTFLERLEWKVECPGGYEKDKFDNSDTIYLLGTYEGKLLCGARFIDTRYPTMISEVFHEYFEDLVLPIDIPGCEISRLFIDKQRRDDGNLRGVAVSKALFLAMIIYCLKKGYQGMYAIVSSGMYVIFRQANWKVKVLRKGTSEKGETIYYIFMPANKNVAEEIINKDKKNLWLQGVLQQLQGLTLSDIQ